MVVLVLCVYPLCFCLSPIMLLPLPLFLIPPALYLEWSKERLLNAWIVDPRDVCEKAGVDLPEVLTLDNIDDTMPSKGGGGASNEIDCSICYCPIDELVEIQCEHLFCKDCWQQLVCYDDTLSLMSDWFVFFFKGTCTTRLKVAKSII